MKKWGYFWFWKFFVEFFLIFGNFRQFSEIFGKFRQQFQLFEFFVRFFGRKALRFPPYFQQVWKDSNQYCRIHNDLRLKVYCFQGKNVVNLTTFVGIRSVGFGKSVFTFLQTNGLPLLFSYSVIRISNIHLRWHSCLWWFGVRLL